MILSDAAIRNRATVGVLICLIVALGVYNYLTLPRESAPDVKIATILVTTPYEGVSPEDVESQITNEIENELMGLKGVKEIQSTSAEGLSQIRVDFLPDVDIEDALRWVKDKVDLAEPELPQNEDRKEPQVTEINIAEFPIMMINISGEVSPVVLKEVAEEMDDRIQAVPGVLDVEVLGALEREIRIEFDPDRLAMYDLSLNEVLTLIPTENVNVSAGGLETPGTKINVRLSAEFRDPEKINALQLTSRDGKPVYLTDVAEVRDTFKDRVTISRLNGRPSISVAVKKRVGADIVQIAGYVKRIIAEFRKRAPETVRFDLTLDRSDEIHMMIWDLENNIVSGLVLVVGVLMLFMGLRSSLIVAAAIPLSMLMSFAVIQALGYTLNMIVLFALILALGMLVDNAIVIVENIYRYMQLGYGRIEAAMKGTGEVAWPVITSTATTVAAFSPLLFWPDTMGDFMKYIPITAIITLISSLFVALVINPVLVSVIGGRPHKRLDREGHHPLLDAYRGLLRSALRHRVTTIGLAVTVLLGVGVLFKKYSAGVELFPTIDPDRAVITLRGPQGMNIDRMDRLTKRVERRVEPLRTDPEGEPIIEHIITNVGSAGGFDFGANTGGPHVSNLTVQFVDFAERNTPSEEALDRIRDALTDIPEVEVQVERDKPGPPTGAAVTVRIIGRKDQPIEELNDLADEIKRRIVHVPNLVNLRTDTEAARPELRFQIDRERAKKLGLNTAVVGNFLKTAIFGATVSTYREYTDDYDITIRLPERRRINIEDLFRLRVPTATGTAVPLSSLGTFAYRPGLGNVFHIDQKRVVSVLGDAEGRLGPAVLDDVMDRLDEVGPVKFFPSDITEYRTLLRDLVERRGAVAERAWGLLDARRREQLRDALATLRDGGTLSREQRSRAAHAMNALATKADLVPPGLIAPDALGPQGRELLNRNAEERTDRETHRLNRLVLEAAWPDAIRSRERLELPKGYALRYAGEREEQEKSQKFLSRAFAFALLVIVMILVAQFNTLSAPLIIMTTVVLSLVGVLSGLLIFDLPFGIVMTGVGVISLAGVVVNNAIVLLDYTRQLQREGNELMDAAVEAGATRLRPVVLTATTTILGLAPMATGVSFDFHTLEWATRSESSQWWRSMAVVVIFGLMFATVLTLVVVPTLYVTFQKVAMRLGFGGLKKVGAEHQDGWTPG